VATASEIARRYIDAIGRRDLPAAVALWAPGSVDRLVGQEELIAPDGIARYFGELFEAFPDFEMTVDEVISYRGRCAVRWRARGTFAGPGRFQGFAPNGARIAIEGCDVITVTDGLITHNDAYLDGADIARQLGLLPPRQSPAERLLAGAANARTRLRDAVHGGGEVEIIAPGVWVLRGGRPRTMNVYLIEDEGGVTLFDAGIADMRPAVSAAAARLGGLRRVVLGHADADHRGTAPALGVPVYCHQREVEAARSPSHLRDYWDLGRIGLPGGPLYPWLIRRWDGGAAEIAGTVAEGDEVAGFRVVELPGHAPGLIGLFRERDRLALASDCVYTIDPETGRRRSRPALPHPAFNLDGDQARDSIRKLAALRPAIVWTGHARPVAGEDVERQLLDAAAASAEG
jgi:steroid delta-isomerase-like uncharacterized protein